MRATAVSSPIETSRLVSPRCPQRRNGAQKKETALSGGLSIAALPGSELEGCTQIEGAANLGLEQCVFTHAVDEQRVALVGQVLRFEDQGEVVVDVPRGRAVDEQVGLVALQVATRRGRNSADVLVAVGTGEADAERAVVVEQSAA